MRTKLLSLLAAVALLGACSTDPQMAATTSGSGASSGASTAAVTSTATESGPAAGSQEDLAVNVGDRVFFGFDKFDLTADARTVLERQAFWMRKNGAVTVLIEGHCDERGTREYNIALGERRANAVRDYLLTLGIDANRIKTISYGKERPVDGGHTETAWEKNRRAVTRVN